MSIDSLDEIKYRINAGDREGARLALVDLLKADPDHVDAWALLAILLSEPAEQVECYRQILRVDPENRQAAAWLEVLTSRITEPSAQEKPSAQVGTTLQCKKCGGVTEVQFVGELRDKRAFCPYCGSQIDLPDTFQRVERKREHAQDRWGASRTVDSVLIETRRDRMPGEPSPSALDELDRLLQALDLPDADEQVLRQLRDRGSTGGPIKQVSVSSGAQSEERSLLDRIVLRMREDALGSEMQAVFAEPGDDLPKPGSLDPDDIIRLAGGALPPEERRECHNCGAVVSRNETRCPWCSVPLLADGEG
jgi:RNA polymerase subunit RPABC4/transcription elongation factor Spt4